MTFNRVVSCLFLPSLLALASCSDTTGTPQASSGNPSGTAGDGTSGSAASTAGSSNLGGAGSGIAGASSMSGGAAGDGSMLAGAGGAAAQAGAGGMSSSGAGQGGMSGSAQGGSAGTPNSSGLCEEIEGMTRPAFTPPVSGCGGIAPGIRTAVADRKALRPVCPATPVVETAIEPNCPAANPNDNLPDDDALQTCLNRGGLTALPQGSPGFILAKGIKVFNNGQTLRGADPAKPARFVAAATLQDTMIRADTITDLVVRFLELDGNRDARTAFLPMCSGYRVWASGLVVRYSRNFVLSDNHIVNTLCGSALEVDGSDFEVARNVIEGSGHGLEAKDAPEPWADGITLHNCWGGEVHDNKVVDATDVGIVSGGGSCSIVHNEVLNTARHTFGGITLHDFTLKGVDHSGSVVAHNIVTGQNGMTSFGFSLGIHPWHVWPFQGMPAPYNKGGTVSCNNVSGSNFNIEIDGVDGITVLDNTIGATGGSPRCKGPPIAYAVHPPHVLNSTVQPGYTEREFDGCIP
jgi:hypothetical protein